VSFWATKSEETSRSEILHGSLCLTLPYVTLVQKLRIQEDFTAYRNTIVVFLRPTRNQDSKLFPCWPYVEDQTCFFKHSPCMCEHRLILQSFPIGSRFSLLLLRYFSVHIVPLADFYTYISSAVQVSRILYLSPNATFHERRLKSPPYYLRPHSASQVHTAHIQKLHPPHTEKSTMAVVSPGSFGFDSAQRLY
jgi:hypothetical protein